MNCETETSGTKLGDGISHYHCSICSGVYKRPDVFKNHLKTHANDTKDADPEVSSSGPLTCETETIMSENPTPTNTF